MEGDLANLPEIVKFKDKYNCCVMVDDAHGLGVMGQGGRGVCNHFGLTDQVEMIVGTFSKSLAAIGGFVAADKEITNWIRHHARSYIFSASNTPAATAAALPPEEPPGTLSKSHGLCVGKNAECSVELPIATSSMFNFPRYTKSSLFNFSISVAS
jgi:aspartate/methionine/tyrosine aminotransferase